MRLRLRLKLRLGLGCGSRLGLERHVDLDVGVCPPLVGVKVVAEGVHALVHEAGDTEHVEEEPAGDAVAARRREGACKGVDGLGLGLGLGLR